MPPSLRTAVLLAAMLLSGACGGDPPESPPTGVDGLVVPTPSPDPADFVGRIDNPWLPLVAGSSWVYQDSTGGEVRVTVTQDTREVAGVTTTEVRTVSEEDQQDSVAWFAQDDRGNVWTFGEEGSWEAGVGGAEAGLAMPAEPRVGDGYLLEWSPGVAEARGLVRADDGTGTVPAGSFGELVVVEVTSPLEPGVVVASHFARGVGLVLHEVESGGDERLELVSTTSG